MRTVVTYVMIVVVLLSLLVACGGEQAAEVVETEAPTEEAAQVAEEPTETPEPEPTDTPEPTEEPTVEATVAAEFELEPLEHPSGAFSSLVPVDAFLTDVDSDDLEFPSVRATYLDRLIIQEGDIAFGVSASVQPKADDAILADIYEDVLDNMSPADTESIEIVSQEHLDEDRLLLDLKGIDETLSDSKLLLVDGGPSVFALLFLTSDVEATEGTWTAISEGYTYDPALTADLLANPDAFAEEAADIALERMEHPSGAFSSLMPVDAPFSDVDADDLEFPSVRAMYLDRQTELTFGVAASVQPKADDATLADMPEKVLNSLFWSMSPEDIESIEILSQEQLHEDHLLFDIDVRSVLDETVSDSKLLLVDGGSSAFALLFFTTDAEATEAAWMEIREGYTYDPDLTADLLAEIADAAAAEDAAIASIELEPFEHPSGAFSILIPADSWSTGVDSAAESKYPNLYSSYVEDDIGFGLEAAVFPKPEDAALEDMFDVFLNDVILKGKIDVEVISQEQERLDDDRLLVDVALLSPGMAGHPLHQKVLLVDGGTSVFGLVVEDQDLEATEPVWTEILNSYTYDPELTADLLAEY